MNMSDVEVIDLSMDREYMYGTDAKTLALIESSTKKKREKERENN
jgi:hypothetical protein